MTKIAIVGATDPTGIHLVAELRKTAAGRARDRPRWQQASAAIS